MIKRIMFLFLDEWDLNDLSRIMQVPPTVLRKKIGFWQSHNLINEVSPDVFLLNEEQANKESVANADVVEDYESESAMASTQDQRKEELQVKNVSSAVRAAASWHDLYLFLD